MSTGGSGPHQYTLGNKIEEQVLIFLDETPSAGKTFILDFERYTTQVIHWPIGNGSTTAADMEVALNWGDERKFYGRSISI